MHIYVRTEIITNVIGRADYISSPDRQEHLLAVSGIQDKAYWRQLAKDSQAAWCRAGGDRKNTAREAREIHVMLPRNILDMVPKEQQFIADQLSAFFREKYALENLTGLHLSKTDNNVHAHILFPERPHLLEPEIRLADRNAFFDEKGVRRRTKKEVLDEDGRLRPGCRIVPKGEILYCRHFGDTEPIYAEKAWIQNVKQDLADWVNETLQPDLKREVFDPEGPYLAQVKIGKGRSDENEERIRKYNADIKAFNAAVRNGRITEEQAQEIKLQVILSPNHGQGLRAALHMLFSNSVSMTEELQGGIRTHTGEDEDKKRQLRELYRKAAEARREAAALPRMSLEWNQEMAFARKYSAQIDRLRRELGYYKDEDYARQIRKIEEELRKKQEWVLRCKYRVAGMESRVHRLEWSIKDIEKQILELPLLFMSKKEKAQKQRLEVELAKARIDLKDARIKESVARMQYKEEKRIAKEKRKELKKERHQIQQERRLQSRDKPQEGR